MSDKASNGPNLPDASKNPEISANKFKVSQSNELSIIFDSVSPYASIL